MISAPECCKVQLCHFLIELFGYQVDIVLIWCMKKHDISKRNDDQWRNPW